MAAGRRAVLPLLRARGPRRRRREAACRARRLAGHARCDQRRVVHGARGRRDRHRRVAGQRLCAPGVPEHLEPPVFLEGRWTEANGRAHVEARRRSAPRVCRADVRGSDGDVVAALATRVRRQWACERGAELIEFTFVFPLLLLVVAGIIDFGFLFQRYEVVTNAAREGARVAILPDYEIADVQQRVAAYLTASGLTKPAPAASVTYSNIPVNPPGGPTMSAVTVTVNYPHDYLILGPIAGLFGGAFNSITLSASSTMRREVAALPGN